MNRICLLAEAVRRMRQYGDHALVRLAGDEPSIYDVGSVVAVCESFRMQGETMLFLADADPDEQFSIRQMWFAANRMNPALARYHLEVDDVQRLWFGDLGPMHAMRLGLCHPEDASDPDLLDEIMGKLHSWWNFHNRKIGKGVEKNPRVEYVTFRLQPSLIPGQNERDVVHV